MKEINRLCYRCKKIRDIILFYSSRGSTKTCIICRDRRRKNKEKKALERKKKIKIKFHKSVIEKYNLIDNSDTDSDEESFTVYF